MAELNEVFRKLEERVTRAAELFKQTQAENQALHQELNGFRERSRRYEALEKELQTLRHEREEVRQRVEKLLEQIDGLTRAGSAG